MSEQPEQHQAAANSSMQSAQQIRLAYECFSLAPRVMLWDERKSISNSNPRLRAADAFEKLLEDYPALRRFGGSLLFAVNQEYARMEREIADGDELAVFRRSAADSGSAGILPASTSDNDSSK